MLLPDTEGTNYMYKMMHAMIPELLFTYYHSHCIQQIRFETMQMKSCMRSCTKRCNGTAVYVIAYKMTYEHLNVLKPNDI